MSPCAVFQSISKAPLGHDKGAYTQIIAIIKRMGWYVGLIRLTSGIASSETETYLDALTQLYSAILMCNARAALQINQRSGPLCLDEVLAGVEAATERVMALSDWLYLQTKVTTLLETSSRQAEERAATLELSLAPLQAEQRPPQEATFGDSDFATQISAVTAKTLVYREFAQWDGEHDRRILWISGRHGVRKAALSRGIIQDLHAQPDERADDGTSRGHTVVSYFIDGSRQWPVDALSVIKSLIHGVLTSQSELTEHLEHMLTEKYASVLSNMRKDFAAPGDATAMAMLLLRIVCDGRFRTTYFVLDGIDEMDDSEGDLAVLYRLVAKTVSLSRNVKWLLLVDRPRWTRGLGSVAVAANLQLHLDMERDFKAADVSMVADTYIRTLVGDATESAEAGYKHRLHKHLLETLESHAPSMGNLLWTRVALDTALASSQLPWKAVTELRRLTQDAPTVESLYKVRLDALRELPDDGWALCNTVLSIVAAAFRPLSVADLACLGDLPPVVDLEALCHTLLSSFLTVSDNVVRFAHISAKGFIKDEMASQVQATHKSIAQKCVTFLLRKRCKCDCPSVHDDLVPEAGIKPTTVPDAESGGEFDAVSGAGDSSSDATVNYATDMWIMNLSETVKKGDSEAVNLAVHLLSEHLVEWLSIVGSRNAVLASWRKMRQLHASMIAAATSSSDAHGDRHAACQMIGEVVLALQIYQGDLRTMPAIQVSGEVGELGTGMSLLFSSRLPRIREILQRKYVKWLETPPQVRPNDLAVPLHSIRHADWALSSCYSPDGKLIASASDDRHVRIWDAETGNLQYCFDGADEYYRNVDVSCWTAGNGAVVLAASYSNKIVVWDAESGNSILTPPALPGSVNSITLSPCGDKVAAATVKGLVVWNKVHDSSESHVCVEYTDKDTRCTRFSPDGKWLASSEGSKITIWDATKAKTVAFTLPEQNDTPLEPENSQVVDATGQSENGDEASDKDEARTTETHETDGAEVNGVSAAGGEADDDGEQVTNTEREAASSQNFDVARDGEGAVEGAGEGGVESAPSSGHTDSIDGLAFSRDSEFLASGSDDHTARVWDLKSRSTVAILDFHTSYVNDVSFSVDGSCIATASSDSTIAIWRRKSKSWGSGETRRQPDQVLLHDRYYVSAIQFSPISPSVLLSSNFDKVVVWDIDADAISAASEAESSCQIPSHSAAVCCVAISPDGNLLASASFDGMICLWSGEDGLQLRASCTEPSSRTEVLAMEFSSDSELLATAAKSGFVSIWSVVRKANGPWTPLSLLHHSDWVRDVVFDPSGDWVATACDDGMARIFDVSGARLSNGVGDQHRGVYDLPSKTFGSAPSTGYIFGVAFSSNGEWLASGGDGHEVCLWGIKSDNAEPERKGEWPGEYIRGVAFAGNDQKLVTVSHSGAIAVWTWADSSAQLSHKTIQGTWDDPYITFRKMRFDPEYPGVAFTEHGAVSVDLDKGDDESNSNSDVGNVTRRWVLPRSAIVQGVVQWKTHRADLPEELRPTNEDYSWRVHGRKIFAGGQNGQVSLLRFAEDVNPVPREQEPASGPGEL